MKKDKLIILIFTLLMIIELTKGYFFLSLFNFVILILYLVI
jgi:hypothetical protein